VPTPPPVTAHVRPSSVERDIEMPSRAARVDVLRKTA
jgi:hypothetical protein